MDPEERLEAWLTRHPLGADARATDGAVESDDARDLAPLLGAAARVAEYCDLAPTPSFAHELEARLLAQSAQLRVRESGLAADAIDIALSMPAPLADEVHTTDTTATTDAADARIPAQSSMRNPQELRRLAGLEGLEGLGRPPRVGPARRGHVPSVRRWHAWHFGRPLPRVARIVWPAVAAVLLLLAGVGSLGTMASPGSSLYELHRWEQGVQVELAGAPADRARLHLQYAWEALRALDTVVAQSGGAPAYEEALGAFDAEAHAVDSAVAQVPAGSDQVELSAQWQTLRGQARHDLRAALTMLAWPQRVLTSSTLGYVGEPIPRVAQVSLQRSSTDGEQVWACVVTGSGFLPGAQLLVDGQALGVTTSESPTQLVAVVTAYAAEPTPTSVGIGNPDGTAATTDHVTIEVESDGGHQGSGTPTKQSTPGSDGGGGSSSGGSGSGDGGGSGSGSGDHTPTPTVSPTPTATPNGSGSGGSGGH